ncbi:asparaginase [Candidatus Micrarchaeota archaeon]|jgi:L-asparaginase|nr:asparaginase [Candidatus Micrarchaeota archaeon]
MTKPRVLVIETGGTIAQTKGKDKILRISPKPVTSEVINKFHNIDIDVERMKPIDSTEMKTEDRVQIAKIIYDNVNNYDGFVVVHGTDTMADTSAALTYMLQDVGKPIILTGSILPLEHPRTDGYYNLESAITIATLDIGEVAIVFGNGIYRGSRTVKIDSGAFSAFDSPRSLKIGENEINIKLAPTRIQRFEGNSKLFTEFDTNISIFYPVSGVNTNDFDLRVENPNIHGIVFVGVGKGNISEEYYRGIKKAKELDKPVVIVSECLKGTVEGTYEVGAIPLQLGAISGKDLTLQAAVQKLMYALGLVQIQGENVIEQVTEILNTNFGDIKQS